MNDTTRPLAVGVTPLETRREVILRLATRAEELGYTAFFVAEGWGHDASVLLAEIAGRTRRIGIGTGVLNAWGRSPGTIAMLATSLAAASDGRFTLGLGAGSPQLVEGLHGVPFRESVERLGAVTRQIRGLLAGDRATKMTKGSQPLRLAATPAGNVPIALAGLGPAAVRLCGEVGDAWFPFLLPVSGLKERVRLLEEGAGIGDRDVPAICPAVPSAVSADPVAARRVAAWWVTFYLTSMGPLYARTLRGLGLGSAVDAVLDAARAGAEDLPASASGLVEELTVGGGGAAARAGLDRWYGAGATMPVVVLPPGRGVDELDHTLDVLRPT